MTNPISADLRHIVLGCNRFAVDLYRQLGDDFDRQFFFSPYSIACALGMALAGAKEHTAREIQQTLHLSIPVDRIHHAFAQLREATKTVGLKFNVANRIWCQHGYPLEPGGVESLAMHYSADLGITDFGQPGTTCEEINAWVAEQTENRITQLVADLPPFTRMILTNAIYFAGYWEVEFSASATCELPFWYRPEESYYTAMMRKTAEFPYQENSIAQIVQLPYRQEMVSMNSPADESWPDFKQRMDDLQDHGNQFAMQILLPKESSTLSELEEQLDQFPPANKEPFESARVSVRLPKFHFEYGTSLKDPMQSLGIHDAFEQERANFQGFSQHPEGFLVGEIIHQATIRVDEQGSEASAATGIIMAGGCAVTDERPIEFRADHPFVIQIVDRRTGLIHFMGRVSRPEQGITNPSH